LAHQGTKAIEFVTCYTAYASILEALGYKVDESSVLDRIAQGNEGREATRSILDAHRGGVLNGQRVSPESMRRMRALLEDLTGKIGAEAPGKPQRPYSPEALVLLLGSVDEGTKDSLADIVSLDGHRGMVRPRLMSVEEFQAMLRDFAGDQTVARQRLIAHLRGELARRGIHMSCETIEERFRANPAVRTMPYCVKHIFRSLGDEYRTGLVPMSQLTGQEDADEWLGQAQRTLRFRSQSSMHKAVAEATALTYDCVHKALSGRKKAKRIQVEIKRCFEDWLSKAARGEELGVREDYLGVPVGCMCPLLAPLVQTLGTKEAVYRLISQKTGLRTGSIRRYFQDDGQLKFAPLGVYRVASELATRDAEALRQEFSLPAPRCARAQRRSKSTSPRCRAKAAGRSAGGAAVQEAAGRIAKEAKSALARWQMDPENKSLEVQFKTIRRALIMKVRERRTVVRGGA